MTLHMPLLYPCQQFSVKQSLNSYHISIRQKNEMVVGGASWKSTFQAPLPSVSRVQEIFNLLQQSSVTHLLLSIYIATMLPKWELMLQPHSEATWWCNLVSYLHREVINKAEEGADKLCPSCVMSWYESVPLFCLCWSVVSGTQQ